MRALLDSRDLPQNKRTQPIYNGTKQLVVVVTHRELNKSKMSKTQYHFLFPKFTYSLYLATFRAPDSSK